MICKYIKRVRKYFSKALKPECSHLGPIKSLEDISFEDYISVLECQPDLAGVGDAKKQAVSVS